MQRPRNRQNRQIPPNNNTRGANQNHRTNNQNVPSRPSNSRNSNSVPTTSQVTPQTPVSIILKADQPTGRQVQGIVQDVLTRGNHPRGIKVRLVDGRVGRVQRVEAGRIGSEGLGLRGGVGVQGLDGSGGETWGGSLEGGGGFDSSRQLHPQQYDHQDRPPMPVGGYTSSLGDFLPPDHPLLAPTPELEPETSSFSSMPTPDGGGGGQGEGEMLDFKGQMQMCPVCEAFEGDEVAVSRHVGEHFN